jgi:DNA modification methylase
MTPGLNLRCGDYRQVLSDLPPVDLFLTSPPYNLGTKTRSARIDGRRKLGSFDPKSFGGVKSYGDDLPEAAYQEQQAAFLLWCESRLAVGGVIAYNVKNRKRQKRLITPYQWLLRPEVAEKLTVVEEIVWDRGSTHNHDSSQLWAQTERVYILRRPQDPWRFKHQKARPLPYTSDVWRIPLESRRAASVRHDAAFPKKLVAALIEAYSQPGQVVCDPYAGSGTTLIVAMEHGRQTYGAEINPEHYERAIDRISKDLETIRGAQEQKLAHPVACMVTERSG